MAESENKPLLSVRGNKVGLGSWLPEHFELWMAGLHDVELGLYSDGGFAMPNREREAEIFATSAKSDRANFAIYALPEEKPIGSVGLFGNDPHRQLGTFGITIWDKSYWGKGYGTEAVKLTLDYGFRFMNLYNIMLDTSGFNARAIRAYEKAGFKVIGRRRGANIVAGQRYDQIFMDCLASEFVPPEPGWFKL